MTREFPQPGERPLRWIGSSKKDLKSLPAEVQKAFGYALHDVQSGRKPLDAKALRGLGSGVLEIVEDFIGDTFRAVYTVRFEHAVYVLHVFQKKSKNGIATSQRDQQMIAGRLKDAQQDYEVNYGEK